MNKLRIFLFLFVCVCVWKTLVVYHLLPFSYNVVNIRMSEVEEEYLNIFSYPGYNFFFFSNRFKNRLNQFVQKIPISCRVYFSFSTIFLSKLFEKKKKKTFEYNFLSDEYNCNAYLCHYMFYLLRIFIIVYLKSSIVNTY